MSEFDIRWTEKKIAQRLALIEPLAYARAIALGPIHYQKLDGLAAENLVDPQLDDSPWESIQPPCAWSEWKMNFVLRASFQVPAEFAPESPVLLNLPLGERGAQIHPEGLAYLDGKPYAGIDRHHHEILLPVEMRDGNPHQLAISGWTSTAACATSRPYLGTLALVELNQAARDFANLARITLNAAAALPENNAARSVFLNTLEEAFQCLDLREPLAGSEDFYASLPRAYRVLRKGISSAGTPQPLHIYAAGHAHIDLAWLWTLAQAKQKARRTFYSVLRFMEQYPEYHFTQSQPQLYDYVRQIDPDLFDAIRERVADGRWEAIGGMWVEADCNLSGPESLARQFLMGRQFFRDHFGKGAESPVLWLPDVFGYAGNLPQLIREAGLEYFFTIKIGWNQYNRLPYDSFYWQGLDGTRVLTHFSTTPEKKGNRAATYNADTTPEKVLATWSNFQQKELVAAPLLISYGHGDGGGGPERAQIENVRELKCFPEMPVVQAGKVVDFFRELEATAGNRLPVWNGELYLEYHRGTYTTQSRNKRANRKSEFALHDAEFLAALAAKLDPDFHYPNQELQEAWQLVLLNQFHDILPGSSINEVYRESQEQYARVGQLAQGARRGALEAISRHTGGDLLIVNPTGFARDDLAFLSESLPEDQVLVDARGKPVPVQRCENGTWIDLKMVESLSVLTLMFEKAGEAVRFEPPAALSAFDGASTMTVTPSLLENERLRVELNQAGDITRVYDKENDREVLPDGNIANQFLAFEDRSMGCDAWDIDIFYDDKFWFAEPADAIRVLETGPLRGSLEIQRKVLNSRITQVISLTRDSSRLDFDTTIEWHERHVLLKTAFPVDVLAPAATYEIQWGNVERPTHRNTSWDWARFETAAQKWVDLSEGDYGVSLLNDCKYGHDIHENVMRLSLLRGTTSPDPEADQGEHHFSYSLLPHAGGWGELTIAAAYALNDPLIVYRPETKQGAGEDSGSILSVDRKNLVIETVKQAEDGQGWIVRLYESRRMRGTAHLRAAFPLSSAWRANLLEENQQALEIEDGQVEFGYRPYQIITLRVE